MRLREWPRFLVHFDLAHAHLALQVGLGALGKARGLCRALLEANERLALAALV